MYMNTLNVVNIQWRFTISLYIWFSMIRHILSLTHAIDLEINMCQPQRIA